MTDGKKSNTPHNPPAISHSPSAPLPGTTAPKAADAAPVNPLNPATMTPEADAARREADQKRHEQEELRNKEQKLKEAQEKARENLPPEEKARDAERAKVIRNEDPHAPVAQPSRDIQDRVARANTPPPSNRPDQQIKPEGWGESDADKANEKRAAEKPTAEADKASPKK